MSRKKNKKIMEKNLTLIEPEGVKKETTAERLSRILFNDCLKNGKKLAGCYESDRINIIAYTLNDCEEPTIDDITCYIITSKSNSQVSVYVDDKTIEVTLGNKTPLKFTDKQLEFMVANMIRYINDFVV